MASELESVTMAIGMWSAPHLSEATGHHTQLRHQFIVEVLLGHGPSLMRGAGSGSSREAAEILPGLSAELLGLPQQAHQTLLGGAKVIM